MKLKTKKNANGIFVKYTIATLCLILIITISIINSKYIDENVSDITKKYLSDISMQNVEVVNGQIEADFRTLEVISRLLGNLDCYDADNICETIKSDTLKFGFINIGIISTEGRIVFSTEVEDIKEETRLINVSDREYFKKAMSGETNISENIISRISKKLINVYATPLIKDKEVIGVVVATFDNDVLSRSICIGKYGEEGHSFIVDGKRNIVFEPTHKSINNMYTSMAEAYLKGLLPGAPIHEQVKNDLIDRKSGIVEIYRKDLGIYLTYHPLEINDWYYISVVPVDDAISLNFSAKDEFIRFVGFLSVLITIVILYFLFIRNQSIKLIQQSIKEQSINDASYRIIMDQTNDILFEYNTIKKTYIHSNNFLKTFGYEPTKKGFITAMKKSYIHPDDVKQFIDMYREMLLKKCLVEGEIRIVKADGEYIWTRIHMTGIHDSDGDLVRVIGRIVNIDEHKKVIDTLKEKAVLDSATGLYNKQTTQDMIISFLEGEGKNGKHALLIIDIDDFKEINDDHGHRKGDMIISELGAEISKMFRTTDILGRIGGDEFMVLIKDIENKEFIIDKAKLICGVFKDRDLETRKNVTVSTSIGIAIYDTDGNCYEDLYEAADQALYTCKVIEKGTFAFYHSNPVD